MSEKPRVDTPPAASEAPPATPPPVAEVPAADAAKPAAAQAVPAAATTGAPQPTVTKVEKLEEKVAGADAADALTTLVEGEDDEDCPEEQELSQEAQMRVDLAKFERGEDIPIAQLPLGLRKPGNGRPIDYFRIVDTCFTSKSGFRTDLIGYAQDTDKKTGEPKGEHKPKFEYDFENNAWVEATAFESGRSFDRHPTLAKTVKRAVATLIIAGAGIAGEKLGEWKTGPREKAEEPAAQGASEPGKPAQTAPKKSGGMDPKELEDEFKKLNEAFKK